MTADDPTPDLDQRLRSSLGAVAATQDPADDWDGLLARHHEGSTPLRIGADPRRSRRPLLAVAAVALVALAAAALVATVGGDDQADLTTSTSTSTSVPASTSTPTSATSTTTTAVPEALDGEDLLALDVVEALLDDLRADDLAAASGRWTGYPEAFGEDLTNGRKEDLLAAFADAHAWLLEDPEPELTVVASFGSTTAVPVVTATADLAGGGRRSAAYVLTAALPGEPPQVDRLPTDDEQVTPAAGTAVAPGATIQVDQVPLEGGARAYVDGIEVPTSIDLGALTTSIEVPADATGEIVVTITLASSETPTASAWWFTVAG